MNMLDKIYSIDEIIKNLDIPFFFNSLKYNCPSFMNYLNKIDNLFYKKLIKFRKFYFLNIINFSLNGFLYDPLSYKNNKNNLILASLIIIWNYDHRNPYKSIFSGHDCLNHYLNLDNYNEGNEYAYEWFIRNINPETIKNIINIISSQNWSEEYLNKYSLESINCAKLLNDSLNFSLFLFNNNEGIHKQNLNILLDYSSALGIQAYDLIQKIDFVINNIDIKTNFCKNIINEYIDTNMQNDITYIANEYKTNYIINNDINIPEKNNILNNYLF